MSLFFFKAWLYFVLQSSGSIDTEMDSEDAVRRWHSTSAVMLLIRDELQEMSHFIVGLRRGRRNPSRLRTVERLGYRARRGRNCPAGSEEVLSIVCDRLDALVTVCDAVLDDTADDVFAYDTYHETESQGSRTSAAENWCELGAADISPNRDSVIIHEMPRNAKKDGDRRIIGGEFDGKGCIKLQSEHLFSDIVEMIWRRDVNQVRRSLSADAETDLDAKRTVSAVGIARNLGNVEVDGTVIARDAEKNHRQVDVKPGISSSSFQSRPTAQSSDYGEELLTDIDRISDSTEENSVHTTCSGFFSSGSPSPNVQLVRPTFDEISTTTSVFTPKAAKTQLSFYCSDWNITEGSPEAGKNADDSLLNPCRTPLRSFLVRSNAVQSGDNFDKSKCQKMDSQ